MARNQVPDRREAWARLRFSVVGQLLSAPPERGELEAALEELSERTWRDPDSDAPVRGLRTAASVR